MPKTPPPRDTAQNNAQHYFSQTRPDPDALAKKLAKKERLADAANTARLRALRLAKEAEDKEKQANDASGADPNRRKRVRKAKSVVRMSY